MIKLILIYIYIYIYIYILGGAERMTNFEIDTIQHQGKGHIFGRYYFGHGVLAFFSLIFSVLFQVRV